MYVEHLCVSITGITVAIQSWFGVAQSFYTINPTSNTTLYNQTIVATAYLQFDTFQSKTVKKTIFTINNILTGCITGSSANTRIMNLVVLGVESVRLCVSIALAADK